MLSVLCNLQYIWRNNMKNFLTTIDIAKLFDYVNSAVVIFDNNGIIIFFNGEASSLFGVSNKYAVGKNIRDLLPQLDVEKLMHSQKSELSVNILIKNKLIENHYFPLYDNKNTLIGTMGILRQIPISASNSSLELSEDILSMFESSYDGIWITDGDGRVLYTNYANEKISGFTKKDVLGKYSNELLHEKWFSNSVTVEVLNSKKRETIMCYNYKTNKQVIVTGNPIFNKDGKIKYVFNNIRDITDLMNQKLLLEGKEEFIHKQKTEIEHLRSQQFNTGEIIICSEKMHRVYEIAQRVAKFDTTVLILGESGSGKEVIAQTIVKSSNRDNNPFIKVNCGAIPENLIESELFGYEKGAFTGANQKGKIGLFEVAQTGTVFLDEIAELPLNLQVKLLRVLQEKELTRVGSTKPVKLDVRIIAATNKDLNAMINQGTFRQDLYYRLNVVSITVPPLHERPEDILGFLNYFLKKFNEKYGLSKVISPEVIDLFISYTWPGNVRELENFIESVMVLTPDRIISKEHLPSKFIQSLETCAPKIQVNGIMPLKEATAILEEALIKKALEKYGSTRKAAQALQVDQSTIVRKSKKIDFTNDNS